MTAASPNHPSRETVPRFCHSNGSAQRKREQNQQTAQDTEWVNATIFPKVLERQSDEHQNQNTEHQIHPRSDVLHASNGGPNESANGAEKHQAFVQLFVASKVDAGADKNGEKEGVKKTENHER